MSLSALEYLKYRKIMTNNCKECENCKFETNQNGFNINCSTFESRHPDQAVKIISDFIKEYETKEYLQNNSEKFQEILSLLLQGKKLKVSLQYIEPPVPIILVKSNSLSEFFTLDCISKQKCETYIPDNFLDELLEITVDYQKCEPVSIVYIYADSQMNHLIAHLEDGREVAYTLSILDLKAFEGEYIENDKSDDIVCATNAVNTFEKFQIVWCNSDARFFLKSLSTGRLIEIKAEYNLCVLGNVYDNPEMIKKSEIIQYFKYEGDLIQNGKFITQWVEKAYNDGILYYGSIQPTEPPTELFLKCKNKIEHVKVGEYLGITNLGEIIICS